MVRRILLIFAIFLSAISVAQTAGSRSLLVDVLDKKTETQIDHLSAQDFRVTLNGRVVEVESAQRVALKSRICILLDASSSMANKWHSMIALATAIAHSTAAGEQVLLVPFSDGHHPPQTVAATETALRTLDDPPPDATSKHVPIRQTALWDAIVYAITANRLQPDDVLVVLSDGEDNSSANRFSDIEKLVAKNQIRVFVVTLTNGYSILNTPEERSAEIDIHALAEGTGGPFIHFAGESSASGSISRQEQAKFSGTGYFLARSAFFPYQLSLKLDPAATGKLDVEVVDARGKRNKNARVMAPERIGDLDSQ